MNRDRIVAHIPGLRRYARMLTGDAHRADDLVQETLARACAKWALWKPGPKLREWLFTLMHNEHVNDVKSAPPATRSLDSQDDEAIHDARRELDPGIVLDLERALLRLPDDQREILLMIAVEDFSYAEAARVAGVPIGTVMSRLSRARRRLRALMDGAGGEQPEQSDQRPHLKVMK